MKPNNNGIPPIFQTMSESQIAKEIYLSFAELMALKLTQKLREVRDNEMALSLSELVDFIVCIVGNFRNAQHCISDEDPPMPYSIEQIKEWAAEYKTVAAELRKTWEDSKI